MREMFSVIIVGYTRCRVLSAANTGGRFFSNSSTNPELTSQISEFLKIIEYQPQNQASSSRGEEIMIQKNEVLVRRFSVPTPAISKKRLNIAHLTGNH